MSTQAAIATFTKLRAKVTIDARIAMNVRIDGSLGAYADAAELAALTALVAPTFLWTVNDHQADELDLGRDAVHNFKVAFGFRGIGGDVDGGVDDSPYWEVFTAFAEDPSFYIANGAGTLVCGPMSAQVLDDNAFDRARRKIDAINEPVKWYFTLAAETPVAMGEHPDDMSLDAPPSPFSGYNAECEKGAGTSDAPTSTIARNDFSLSQDSHGLVALPQHAALIQRPSRAAGRRRFAEVRQGGAG
jgi:hypothetical protein